ncbi:MAG: urease accessory protein [Methylophagaceae bacterium]|jgi:urease accessory protein
MTINADISLIRLMQLCSSTLPIGGFTYSQGLEWAVECQWMTTEADLKKWLLDLVETNLQYLEIPLLLRMFKACQDKDEKALSAWSDILIAHRETSELRLEEVNRGRAMTRLLIDLNMEIPSSSWQSVLAKTQTAGFAYTIEQWKIPIEQAAQGFAWAWLENMVISGVKLVPLGQAAGQRILQDLAQPLAFSVQRGMAMSDEDIGSSSPVVAYVSARHETQYTRLFRS